MRLVDETGLIARFLGHPTPALPRGSIGPGADDAAVVPWDGLEDLVVTSDLVAEGVHFFTAADPFAVGRFLVAVNLSDLAAMGAVPRGFLASYGATRDQGGVWLERVAEGVADALTTWECPLMGGDTKEAGRTVLSGTALGAVPHGRAVRRAGGGVGDVLVVTGPVGGKGALLERLAREELSEEEVSKGLLDVAPRLKAGVALRLAGATAMTDLSDGLARGARLIAAASGLGARLEAEAVPVASAVEALWGEPRPDDPEWRRVVLGTGGEYELLAALPPDRVGRARQALQEVGSDCVPVGSLDRGDGVRLVALQEGPWPLEGLGWRHFRS
ncbi:MAG: thiamine-phosphate kinase [Euryarchaeota archaeon]|nr:thiamine-phosphate kinase [Euryarchaeota archaeon]